MAPKKKKTSPGLRPFSSCGEPGRESVFSDHEVQVVQDEGFQVPNPHNFWAIYSDLFRREGSPQMVVKSKGSVLKNGRNNQVKDL